MAVKSKKLIVNPDLSNLNPQGHLYVTIKDLKGMFEQHCINGNEKGKNMIESHLSALMIGNPAGLCLAWEMQIEGI